MNYGRFLSIPTANKSRKLFQNNLKSRNSSVPLNTRMHFLELILNLFQYYKYTFHSITSAFNKIDRDFTANQHYFHPKYLLAIHSYGIHSQRQRSTAHNLVLNENFPKFSPISVDRNFWPSLKNQA